MTMPTPESDQPLKKPADEVDTAASMSATSERGHLSTEKRLAASAALDALPIEQMLSLMNTQDMTVPRIVRDAIPAITKLTQAVVAALKQDGRLIYLGAGTSGRLGALDAAECPPTFHSNPGQVIGLIAGGDRALREAVEGAEDDEHGAEADLDRLNVNEKDIVVGIAAGGTTPYVWGSLTAAKNRGAATGLITCVSLKQLRQRRTAPTVPGNAPTPRTEARPSLPCEIDYPIELLVGAEVVTGSTRLKAGTATKLTLNMITTAAFAQLGKVWGNLMVDLRVTNDKLRNRALRILAQQASLPRDEALQMLTAANGRVKIALVMARLNVDADEAERRLAETGGRLRPLLGSPKS